MGGNLLPKVGGSDAVLVAIIDESSGASAEVTSAGAIHVNLRDASGTEVSVGGGTQYDEDTVHSSGDKITLIGVVRNDAGTALAADGDRTVLTVNASGALYVTGGGGGTQYTEDAAAAADPVGTVLNLVRKDTLASEVDVDGDNVAARGTAKGELYVKHADTLTVTGPLTDAQLRATAVPVSGTVNIGTFPDNEPFNVAQINGITPLMGNGVTGTGSQRVTIASDNTAFSVNIGTFPDNEPFNVAQINGVAPLMGNGVTGTGSQRVTIASDNTAFTVNVGTFPDNEPFNVAQINGVTPLMGNGVTGTGSQRVTVASDNTAFTVNIGTFPDNEPFNAAQWGGTASAGGSGAATAGSPRIIAATDSPDVTALQIMDDWDNAASDGASVSGDVAHDAADAGEPVKIGGRANLDEPTAVAENDRVNAWFDLHGRQIILVGHGDPESPVTANGSAAGVSVIAAPGAGVSLHICKGSLHNSAAAEAVVSLRDGAAGTIRFTANLAADGGGCLFDFGSRGWKLTANTAFVMDAASATQYCNVTEYYIAA